MLDIKLEVGAEGLVRAELKFSHISLRRLGAVTLTPLSLSPEQIRGSGTSSRVQIEFQLESQVQVDSVSILMTYDIGTLSIDSTM